MDIKEYLGQAFHIDQRINSKIEQLSSLHDLATKATTALGSEPVSGMRNPQQMQDVIAKMVDLENELNGDIDALVELKRAIMCVIKGVKNKEHQTLLEMRYLSFMTWERIAVDLGYSIQHIHRLHKQALEKISVPAKDEMEC